MGLGGAEVRGEDGGLVRVGSWGWGTERRWCWGWQEMGGRRRKDCATNRDF